MRTWKMIAVALSLLVATNALAVEQEGGIRFIVGEPVEEFGDSITDPGFGLAMHYGLRPVPMFTFGVGGSAMIYGSESRRMTLPLVDDFDLTTTNNIADGFVFAQWRPLQGAVQPYAQARFGFHYLWTESKLEDDEWQGDDSVARATNLDDFARFWSSGGGLLVRVYENKDSRSPSVFLDFQVNYVLGEEAEYLREGDVSIVDGDPVFTTTTSETSLTTYELGVVLTF